MEDIIDTEEEIKEIEIVNPYGFIYCTTCKINGKKYIGKNGFCRWENYLGSGKLLKRAIKKYGKENFYREIIYIAYDKDELDKVEIMFIKEHGAVESSDYYNITSGGDGGATTTGKSPSEETRKKISLAQKGEKGRMYGKHHSEETKLKMSLATKGEKSFMFGIPKSKETCKKMSESQIKFTPDQVAEIREKYATGNYIQDELAGIYSVSHATINNIVNYKRAYTIKIV